MIRYLERDYLLLAEIWQVNGGVCVISDKLRRIDQSQGVEEKKNHRMEESDGLIHRESRRIVHISLHKGQRVVSDEKNAETSI